MYRDSKRTCIAIVLLIKPFVWSRSRRRHRRRRGLLKLPNYVRATALAVNRVSRKKNYIFVLLPFKSGSCFDSYKGALSNANIDSENADKPKNVCVGG